MAELKTRPTDADVGEFLNGIADDRRRQESAEVCRLLTDVTAQPPVMWGKDIVGFGTYRYRTSDGKEHEWFVTGFSPRKRAITVYLLDGFEGREDLLARLGPHSTGRSCLYLARLADVDLGALRALVDESVRAERDRAS